MSVLDTAGHLVLIWSFVFSLTLFLTHLCVFNILMILVLGNIVTINIRNNNNNNKH